MQGLDSFRILSNPISVRAFFPLSLPSPAAIIPLPAPSPSPLPALPKHVNPGSAVGWLLELELCFLEESTPGFELEVIVSPGNRAPPSLNSNLRHLLYSLKVLSLRIL